MGEINMPRLFTTSDLDFLQEERTLECDIEMICAIIEEKKRFLARHKGDITQFGRMVKNPDNAPYGDIKPYEEAMIVTAITCLARAKDALGVALEHWRKL